MVWIAVPISVCCCAVAPPQALPVWHFKQRNIMKDRLFTLKVQNSVFSPTSVINIEKSLFSLPIDYNTLETLID